MSFSIQFEERATGATWVPAIDGVLYHQAVRIIQPPEDETAVIHGSGMTREQLFLSHHGLIERIVAWVSSRRGLRSADAQDFASFVSVRLIENDYQILGKFEGRSSFKTYLTAVVNRLYLDFQAERFGKWRPSAEARRRGPVALRLESLLYRDGLTFGEACEVLHTDLRVKESREALYELSLELPRRAGRRPGSDPGPEPVSPGNGSSTVAQAERQALAERTFRILRRALRRLTDEDRLFFRLHLETGLTVADAAKARGWEQKALYRRKDALLKGMRMELEVEGIRQQDVHELLSTLDWDAALTPDAGGSGSSQEEGEP